jgi:hypothetical protein
MTQKIKNFIRNIVSVKIYQIGEIIIKRLKIILSHDMTDYQIQYSARVIRVHLQSLWIRNISTLLQPATGNALTAYF